MRVESKRGIPNQKKAEGNKFIEYSLESANSACSVHDFDANGIWEIETRQYIEYGGGVGSYTFNKLDTYNRKSKSWYPCTKRFSWKFEKQDRFYEALVYAITELPGDKSEYKWADHPDDPFVWEHNGKSFNVHYFPHTDVEVFRKLIGYLDDYPQGLD